MKKNNLTAIKKKASYFIIAMVAWEFFSYFGMQAMLILYLTQHLHLSDSAAYKLYGDFTSLIFVTPILGGWLADKFCGYRYAVMWGCLLIIAGHLVLGGFTLHGLYLGLSLLILGIGLFKSNAICLIADCYPQDSAGKAAAFSWYYVSGNVGSIASQLLCPFVAQKMSWSMGFSIAAFGMVIGLVTLILAQPYFSWQHEQAENAIWNKFSNYKKITISLLLIFISLAITYCVMKELIVGYFLIGISLLSIYMFVGIYKESNLVQRKSLLTVAALTFFATAFWIFDQQGSSSISLFIERFVNRDIEHFIIPAGMFQSINPMIILITGVLMAYVWRLLSNRNIKPSAISKLSVAMLLLTLGFIVLSHAASLACIRQSVSMLLPIISLSLVGAAEIFVDPVLLAAISEASPEKAKGRLVAIYYLAVGAIANYLAAWVANFTTDPTTNIATALTYHTAYTEITYIASFMLFCLVAWKMIQVKFNYKIPMESYYEQCN